MPISRITAEAEVEVSGPTPPPTTKAIMLFVAEIAIGAIIVTLSVSK